MENDDDDDDDVCNRTGEEEGGGWKTMHSAQKGALDSIDSERRQRQRGNQISLVRCLFEPLWKKTKKDSIIMPPGRRQAMGTKVRRVLPTTSQMSFFKHRDTTLCAQSLGKVANNIWMGEQCT